MSEALRGRLLGGRSEKALEELECINSHVKVMLRPGSVT